jgi:hypothetical protein
MSVYKVHYFGPGGRAESIRLLLTDAGVAFEDVHVAGRWPEVKPTTPLGQLPVLEVDGVMYAQSHAILRMLARKFGTILATPRKKRITNAYYSFTGLYGDNELQAFYVDQFVDTVNDMQAKVSPLTYNVAPERKVLRACVYSIGIELIFMCLSAGRAARQAADRGSASGVASVEQTGCRPHVRRR